MKYSSANMRMWSRLGPSGSLGAAAMEIGSEVEKALFVTADMTFAAGLERFKNNYPDRIYDVGIAEQNLVGVSAGLASEGFIPFAVTYSTFFATRALDQVKMCLGYMKQPVKLIGLNAGFAAGILGPTHMSIEDLAAMRSIPGMTIVAPADMTELVKAVLAASKYDGPMFIRFTGEMNQSQVYSEDFEFEIGRANVLKEGEDITLIACGTVVYECIKAAMTLEEKGISCKVIDMHTIKPLDTGEIIKSLNSKMIATVEEHNVYGGLGSAVSEILAELKNAPPLERIGVKDYYPHAGAYSTLLHETGLDAAGIEKRITKRYKEVTE